MVKLAAVEAAPVFLNKSATTKKVCDLILEAGSEGADVIGFPECFLSGYPGWHALISPTNPLVQSLYLRLFESAVEVPGPEVDAISEACKKANVYAVVGVNERRADTTGTLFNTQLIFGRDGALLHKHQKYIPTVGERLIHAPGHTGSKASARTDFGAVSGLICGENGNPLAQYSLGLDYPSVHVASWPHFFGIDHDMSDAIQVAGKAVAFSVGAFVINSAGLVGDEELEAYGTEGEVRDFLLGERRKRRATIYGPGGFVVAGPLEEGSDKEILYADVDLQVVKAVKFPFDYAGHYQRPAIFAHHFKEYLDSPEL
ncbi:nitrilase/cyanide hydratase and apolipoprotein N-acyltransferase [Colletotrichum higginsianum]|uniref:Nitrilase/cyanide hydratase and apolipoprotein N-acyltransferase n=2 Tax=Colletotrichum higginsianum TaxID=80884 RepID=H1VUC7_COLHI|nr:Nitrilase/cyanide hydratase and apolipoprotein N-acyltransferase [Colletotrichum higginsianum IMI 349063]OBR06819.1 Nitrilase/cyanide hydratase and apolipoprotein N-acyltransferase [Colletotrichum higginsianum IMI 349063]TIC97685.1 Nitrilase 3 [Colletotrichum higginsianum]GJD04700.1 nitrilase/cyanide hydratase and apolipoprotein N-acyltransferase [Colletotrichum higginsianum]CCF43836.1 nitrilase/cyanide hydratase and apolipoprotein N-acyltransferase [Colletotrichum higginsianum]